MLLDYALIFLVDGNLLFPRLYLQIRNLPFALLKKHGALDPSCSGVFVDQHCLLMLPLAPRFFTDVVENLFTKLTWV